MRPHGRLPTSVQNFRQEFKTLVFGPPSQPEEAAGKRCRRVGRTTGGGGYYMATERIGWRAQGAGPGRP